MGISRRQGPGGVMGFKGSPGFMAPEILKYIGTEACTEKVSPSLKVGQCMHALAQVVRTHYDLWLACSAISRWFSCLENCSICCNA